MNRINAIEPMARGSRKGGPRLPMNPGTAPKKRGKDNKSWGIGNLRALSRLRQG